MRNGGCSGPSSQHLCPAEQNGTLRPGLGWERGGDKEQKLEMMPSLIRGDHITGGRWHLSQPALSQMKALEPVFKLDQVSESFFTQKLHLEKQGKTSQLSLKIRPRSASQPKPSIFERTPQVYSNLHRYHGATCCQVSAAEEPCSWAPWVRLPRTAHQTHSLLAVESICSDGKRCFYDTTFFWHTAQGINNNTRSRTSLCGLQNKEGIKP